MNTVIAVIFTVCYLYQFVYVPVVWFFHKKKKAVDPLPNSYAVLISARNESAVIGDLIDSINNQTYKLGPVHTFVIADNCTDDTAEIAKAHGATVYTRFNKQLIGKGYALDELLHHLKEDYPEGFDQYLVFDADNLLRENYIEEINKTVSEGYECCVSYRNGKNYGDNWISAGYSHWFLRDSKYLNYARYQLNLSCVIAGTGFTFSRKMAEELNGWPFHMLTEDTEFSAYLISSGRKVGFCENAEFFDEQPTKFSQSWRQRLRWARGGLQVYRKYGGKLFTGFFKYGFSCYDMTMSTMPAFLLTVASLLTNTVITVYSLITGGDTVGILLSYGKFLIDVMWLAFIVGVFTTITEWKRIHTSTFKKILYTITFPFFMATYIPICVAACFYKPSWKPIEHHVTAKSVENLNLTKQEN